ncbi:tRNA (guanine-N(1)-)-methyltransferase [Nannizzia gypsea CBS 118893]|uniref:tRNA (guanine(37)-N1)-methyltransferase n=1 Tax=Arthroderma gypseum (strain ATCC MYA-4604 / CBS 118893) TaxID=535722 RepID=E4UVA1_ARTGP|nr:tRNA (guanine-N(1)-)-methyltransferase [Nannizzia gypsea CBS 118893]EFR02228.1 tRNA (guanine-N(1)-)-methyltransferase [Nannizzia gypsea CBS 118893]
MDLKTPPSTLPHDRTPSPQTMFRPPINRAMRVLDRSFFKKTIPLAAATVFEPRNLGRIKNELAKSNDILNAPRLPAIRYVQNPTTEEEKSKKCILLKEQIQANDATTWSPTIRELVEAKSVELKPYDLQLDYDYWLYHDILSSILPEEHLEETPAGFNQVGHVAHLNLREQYLPYKNLIAEVIRDKNSTVRTVINKVDDVGANSEYRTFAYEHLVGDKNMNVIQHEQGCEFAFDYSKVYWNSRLGNEHTYLVGRFKEGEAVCDVMAGVGPFALPAGKKRVFVYANDLNPHGYEKLKEGTARNKVREFVQPFNMDGREFIRHASQELCVNGPRPVKIFPKMKRTEATEKKSVPPQIYECPPTFDHYVMNLPASAIEFLDAFVGVYAGKESLFEPHTERKRPLVHVYCFSTNSDDNAVEYADICNRISERIQYKITPDDMIGGTGNQNLELEIRDIRLVSPNKRMFCASFRLPAEVIFKS